MFWNLVRYFTSQIPGAALQFTLLTSDVVELLTALVKQSNSLLNVGNSIFNHNRHQCSAQSAQPEHELEDQERKN